MLGMPQNKRGFVQGGIIAGSTGDKLGFGEIKLLATHVFVLPAFENLYGHSILPLVI